MDEIEGLISNNSKVVHLFPFQFCNYNLFIFLYIRLISILSLILIYTLYYIFQVLILSNESNW